MDELKQLWQSQDYTDEALYREVDLAHKPKDLIHRIIKSLKWEHRFNQWGILPGIAFFFVTELWFAISYLVIVGASILYYSKIIARFREYHYSESIYDYLKELNGHLKRFIRHYFMIGNVVFLFGFYSQSVLFESSWQTALEDLGFYYILLSLVFSNAFVFGYIYLLYGKKQKQLQEMIGELGP